MEGWKRKNDGGSLCVSDMLVAYIDWQLALNFELCVTVKSSGISSFEVLLSSEKLARNYRKAVYCTGGNTTATIIVKIQLPNQLLENTDIKVLINKIIEFWLTLC